MDVSIDLSADFRPSFLRHFDANRQLCSSANLAVPEDASSLFNLVLPELNSIMKRDSAAAS